MAAVQVLARATAGRTTTKKAAPAKKAGGGLFGARKAAPAPAKKAAGGLFGGSKKAAPAKTTKKAAPPARRGGKAAAAPARKAGAMLPAQSFEVKIPGQFFQAKNDITIPFTLGFTKGNELFVGRVAMLGFSFSLLGEVLTGKGALAQIGLETGLPLLDREDLILGLILFNVFAATAGALGLSTGKFVPDKNEMAARIPESDGALFQGFGFTKVNELIVGRTAQLGFAASLIGEAITGDGILGQLDVETGLPLSDTEPLLLAFILFFALAAVNEGSGKFVDERA